MVTGDEGREGGDGFIAGMTGKEPFLIVLRELAQTYHAFSAYSAAHVRAMGLTPAQFDVIATLGNTQGMLFAELARRTLVTKGTLTGIIDRLEAKGLVRREVPPEDRRSFRATLTTQGEALFAQVFPAHMDRLRHAFASKEARELAEMGRKLQALRQVFSSRKVGGNATLAFS